MAGQVNTGYLMILVQKANDAAHNLQWTIAHAQLSNTNSRILSGLSHDLLHQVAEIDWQLNQSLVPISASQVAKHVSQITHLLQITSGYFLHIYGPPQNTGGSGSQTVDDNRNRYGTTGQTVGGNTPTDNGPDPEDGGGDDLNQVAKNEPTHQSGGCTNWTSVGPYGSGSGTTCPADQGDDQSSTSDNSDNNDEGDGDALASAEGQTDPGDQGDQGGMGDPDSGDDEGPHIHFGGYHPSNGTGPIDDQNGPPVDDGIAGFGLGQNLGWYQGGGVGSDWGGNNPRYFTNMPDPESSGPGNPRGRRSRNPDNYFPDPEGSGGVGPRSIIF